MTNVSNKIEPVLNFLQQLRSQGSTLRTFRSAASNPIESFIPMCVYALSLTTKFVGSWNKGYLNNFVCKLFDIY